MRIKLQHVRYIPKVLEPGVLYVSEAFGAAAHLCPCGCGSKIRTPLGSTEWRLYETKRGPSLSPSVGNWQKPCLSHYIICRGEVIWCDTWTSEQIALGRHAEKERRRTYYDARDQRGRVLKKIWHWVKSLWGQ